MVSIIQSEADLVSAIYDGPFEDPMWATFLDRLRQRTRAEQASIIFRPPDRPADQAIQLHSGPRAPAQIGRFYQDDAWQRDPVPYFSLREERVYALDELIEPGNPVHLAYRREVLDPNGVGTARLMRITEPGGVSAWLVLIRERPDFTPADGAVLSAIAPHFRRALRTYAEIAREQARSRIATDMMERLNFGWIGLDQQGRVIEASAEGRRLLRHGAGLRRARNGRLIAANPAVERKLAAAIRAMSEQGRVQPRALNVSHDPWVDLLLVPMATDPDALMPGTAMIAYVQGDNRSLADRHEQIAELFGLLPSEARFALAVSRGQSIAEAAASLGLTIETARNYSKKIYAKMGARGQADLVRFILTSVLALA